jgi:hypothetical protein
MLKNKILLRLFLDLKVYLVCPKLSPYYESIKSQEKKIPLTFLPEIQYTLTERSY